VITARPGVFLQADRRLDGCVFHLLELGRTDLTALQALSRLEKLARPEETADDVGARRDHGANLREALSHAAVRADADAGLARRRVSQTTGTSNWG
jgi:hypothetical protein